MNLTYQSEVGRLHSVFIKPVENAFGDGAMLLRQWKELNYLGQPLFQEAKIEYNAFENALRDNGAIVHYLGVDEQVTIDSIYCRDAAIATNHGMILCNMGKEARRGEPAAEGRAFERADIPILGRIEAPGTIEGGDVAWLDEKTLAVGHSYRTSHAGIEQLKALLTPFGIEVIITHLPHYKGPSDVFHLMSILSPVDENLAVVYSPLMPIQFRDQLRHRGFELVEVPASEFESMGCNVLALAPRKCLLVEGNPRTERALRLAGCEVLTYPGAEISLKGGGGPTCLTRPLQRFRL